MAWERPLSLTNLEFKGFVAWAIALCIFSGSAALHVLVGPYLSAVEFITYWPAIILTTFVCGWRQGIAVLLASVVTTWYFYLYPAYSFAFREKATIGAVIGFIALGGIIVLLVAALRETLNRLEEAKTAKQMLFAELQHRVANNLQMVIALLRIARHNLRDPTAAAEALNTAEIRIMTMAQMHRRLIDGSAYENGLEPVLREVIVNAFQDLAVSVHLEVSAASDLTVDQMAALTLLVNEAALNAAKHVFSKGLGSHFEVSLAKAEDGRLHLKITDNGPGISAGAEATSFGLGIMKAFAAQLGGSLAIDGDEGTCLALDFGLTGRA